MSDFYEQIRNVLILLESESRSLKTLAEISGRDILSFYRGADLSDLDLSEQDLTGMNFDLANFRSTNLSGVKYDAGAFNASNLPTGHENLRDKYDSYLYDILLPQMGRISLHARIRPESIEICFAYTHSSYSGFASSTGINLDTLRRARNGKVISSQTLRLIAQEFQSRFKSRVDFLSPVPFSTIGQPMVELLSQKSRGGFSHVPQSDIKKIIELSRRVDISRYGEAVSEERLGAYWKIRPETLVWLSDFYDTIDFEGLPL